MSDPYTDYLARFGAAGGTQPPAKGPAKAPPGPAPDPYSAYLQQYGAGQEPVAERPGFLNRLGSAVGHAVAHPIDTAAGMIAAPVQSFMRTFDTPTEGDEVTTAQRLRGKAGPSAASTRLPVGTILDKTNTPGAQSARDRNVAAVQTVANVAAPGVFRGIGALAPALGTWGTRGAVAAAGAGLGAVQNPDDPAVGATLGAVTPATAEIIARLTGRAAGGVQARLATRRAALDAAPAGAPLRAVREAGRVLGDAFQADDRTPEALRAAVPAAPDDAILLDLGGSAVRAQAQVAASTPRSRGPQRFTEVLNGRLRNEAPALQAAAEGVVGQPAPTRTSHLQQYDAETERIAAPLYEAADAEAAQRFPQGITHPELDALRQLPFAADAWRLAERNAAARRRPLPQAFQVVRRPANGGLVDAHGVPQMVEVLEPTGINPDLRAVREWRRALRDMYETRAAQGQIGTDASGAIGQQLGELSHALGEHLPALRTADQTYAARMRGREAFESGYQFPSQDADALAIQRQGLPDGADPQYQLGALARVRRTLRSTRDTRPAAARIAGSDEMRSQLGAVFPNADPLVDAARTWTDRRNQATEVLRGSQTEPRREARRAFDAAGGVPVEDIANALTRLRPFTAARHAADRLTGGYFENRRLNANADRANVVSDWLTREPRGTTTSVGTTLDPQTAALLDLLALTQRRRGAPAAGPTAGALGASPLQAALLLLSGQRDPQQP